MARTKLCAVLFATLFALMTLPTVPALTVQQEQCVRNTFVSASSNNVHVNNPEPWPKGPVWGPPPWRHLVEESAEAGYNGRCAYVNVTAESFLDNAAMQADKDGDGMGDTFVKRWEKVAGLLLEALVDIDDDGLLNVDEFRWDLVPVCAPKFANCKDFDAIPENGTGGDLWEDGPEVAYWNNPDNDAPLQLGIAVAVYDADRLLDTDGDGLRNVKDKDSDNDNLLDGREIQYGAYPEFDDSDCATAPCTPSWSTRFGDPNRQGNPGSRDGLTDDLERAAWNSFGANAWSQDFDGDGIPSNLLDPDSDNDGLLDGEEFLLGSGQVRADIFDTDGDGLHDGDEDAWFQHSDNDGLVNANDPDSDNDGMPDKWEKDNALSMIDSTDASLDRDGDALTNLQEYQYETNPNDMDSDNDLLLDGEEVEQETDPLLWDTDADGMPDRFEVDNSFDPTDAADADDDPDADSFTGPSSTPWPNLAEYQYKRPGGYSEAATGPWFGGTNPHDSDSDDDGASDGYEAHYGSDARITGDADADPDDDGLNNAAELSANTDPNDPDTDGDGLCDGGRAAACTWPTKAGGNKPGENNYASDPRNTDSDADGIADGQEARLWDSQATGVDPDGDRDGKSGITDSDGDADGLGDGAEWYQYHTNPTAADTDGDGLNDGEEVAMGTDPLDTDTDKDGLSDGRETLDVHTNPLVVDTDGDELGDGEEVNVHQTDPTKPDSEGDGMPDGWEVHHGLQPLKDDAEEDPDEDGARIGRANLNHPENAATDLVVSYSNLQEYLNGTDPHNQDTDLDRIPDGWEVFFGFDPRVGADAVLDFDEDGLANVDEFQWSLVPICTVALRNCWDHEQDPLTGDGGDMWNDGDEVGYWNDPANDAQDYTVPHEEADGAYEEARSQVPSECEVHAPYRIDSAARVEHAADSGQESAVFSGAAVAPLPEAVDAMEEERLLECYLRAALANGAAVLHEQYTTLPWTIPGSHLLTDPDSSLDSDGDGIRNVDDEDSDNDGLLDGPEVQFLGTYPELRDSDCLLDATECTSSLEGGNITSPRQGSPGTGDGAWDGEELQAWLAVTEFAVWVDYDDDGIQTNLLDPESEGDTLLDGEEVVVWGSNPGALDSDRDGLTDPAEAREHGTQPANWDTDSDGLPDGYEVYYAFNPLNPADGGLDSDSDGYNPYGEIPAPESWTNRQEYDWEIPSAWSVPTDGIWWGGTQPDREDSDGDRLLDGIEVHFGSDPLDPESTTPQEGNAAPGANVTSTVVRNNPTNEDLDPIDPVAQAYLSSQSARAVETLNQTVDGNETAALEFVAQLVNETANLVWEQEILDPVRPILNKTPLQRALHEIPVIVRGVAEAETQLKDYIVRGVGILQPALMDSVQSGSPQPLLDATNQVGPYLASAPFVSEALPAPLRRELSEFTVPTPDEIAAAAQDLQESPLTPISEAQELVRELLPASSPLPTFTADRLTMLALTDVYHAMTTASQTTGTPHAATVSDVPFYNVLVNYAGTLHVESSLQVGVSTSIDIDGNAATGDPAGFDATVELTLRPPEDPSKPGLPALPGFRITKIDPSQSYEAAIHAFVQIPGEPTVAALGVNARDGALNPANAADADLPDDLWIRLTDYKPATEGASVSAAGLGETRIGFAVQSSAAQARPVLVQGGLIPVDVADLQKEPVPGEDHLVGARFSTIPANAVLNVHDVIGEAADRLAISWKASQVMDAEIVLVDQSDDEGLRQDLVFDDLPATVAFTQTLAHPTKQRSLSYEADSVLADFTLYSRHEAVGADENHKVYVSATSVPQAFSFDAQPQINRYAYDGETPLSEVTMELSPAGEPCNGSTAANYLVLEENDCTVLHVEGLKSALVEYSESGVTANWVRTPSAGDLTVSIEGDRPFLLSSSSWPASGNFSLTQDPVGARQFAWTSSATIETLVVAGDTRSEQGGVLYQFNVTDLPTYLAGGIDTASKKYDIDANAHITQVDFAYTNRTTDNVLSFPTDYLAVDKTGVGVAVSGRIHGFKNAHVDLSNGDLLHVDAELATDQPLRVLYQGQDGAVDAYLSNVPASVRFDYAYNLTQDRRILDYEASEGIEVADLTGKIADVFFDFHFEDLPTQASFTADNTDHQWIVTANAPISIIDAKYVKNIGTYRAPISGDYVVFYDEPTNSAASSSTVVYAAHLTGFQSALITTGQGEFHVESVRQAAQPFILRYGKGADYVSVDANNLPAYVDATYRPGNLQYEASSTADSIAFDVNLESLGEGSIKLDAAIQNVPTEIQATWPVRDTDPVQVSFTHNSATPIGPASIEWWDIAGDAASLDVRPYLRIEAQSIPDTVTMDYDELTKHLLFEASHAGAPATLVGPELWRVPRGTATINVPSAQEYAFVEQAADGRGSLLLRFNGIQSVDALLQPSNGSPGWFEAKKLSGNRLHVELYEEQTDTTNRIVAANTPSEMRLDFRMDQAGPAGAPTLQGLNVTWAASQAIDDASVLLQSVDEERGTVKQAVFASPQIPTTMSVFYQESQGAHFLANAPFSLNGTYGPREKTNYASRTGYDYALAATENGVATLSMELTGFEDVELDLINRLVHLERDTTRNLQVGVDMPDLKLGIDLQTPPQEADVFWNQPDARLLDYTASSTTARLRFALDMLNPTGLPVVLQADVTGLPQAVRVSNAAGQGFRIDTPLGGSIGDATVEVGLDGTRQTPILPWAEGAVLTLGASDSLQQAKARIVGLESLSVIGTSTPATQAFSLDMNLQRAASLPSASFGVRIKSPTDDAQLTGTNLPQDAILHLAKVSQQSFILDWDASGALQGVVAQTAQNEAVQNHVQVSAIPASILLEAQPGVGRTEVTYEASAWIQDLDAQLQGDETQLDLHAWSIPSKLSASFTTDYRQGTLSALDGAALGGAEAYFQPIGQPILDLDVSAEEFFHIDLTASSGKRGHVRIESLQSARWLFNDAMDAYGAEVHRSQATLGHDVEGRVFLDDGLLVIQAMDLPTDLTMATTLDANLGVPADSLFGFVEATDDVAAKWSASSSLTSADVRFTPANGEPFHVHADQVPSWLEAHASKETDSWSGFYEAGSTVSRATLEGERGGQRFFLDLKSLPTRIDFTVAEDGKNGNVVTQGGAISFLKALMYPRGEGQPTLHDSRGQQLIADAYVLVDAFEAAQPRVRVELPDGVAVSQVSWSSAGSTQDTILAHAPGALLDRSLAYSVRLPDIWMHGKLAKLPSRIQYSLLANGHHHVELQGAGGTGKIDVVDAVPAYGMDEFHVTLSNVPSSVTVDAQWTPEAKHVHYQASQVISQIDVEGYVAGAYFLGRVSGLPQEVELYANQALTGGADHFDGSLTASAPIGRIAFVSPSGPTPPESLPSDPNVISITARRSDGRKDVYADLRNVQAATWDATAPPSGSDGLSAAVTLQRGASGDLSVSYESDQTALVRLYGAPAEIGVVFDASTIAYTAPGHTQRLTTWIGGFKNMRGLGDRLIDSINVNLQGIDEGIRLIHSSTKGPEAGKVTCSTLIDVNGGPNGPGLLEDGSVQIKLGNKAGTPADPSCQVKKDLITLDGLEVQRFVLKATTGTGPALRADMENQILMQETDRSYAMVVELTDLERVTYRTRQDAKTDCDGPDPAYHIEEAVYGATRTGMDLIVHSDKQTTTCKGEASSSLWDLQFLDLPVRVEAKKAFIDLSDGVHFRTETLDTSWGPIGKIRFWKGGWPWTAALEDIPTTQRTEIEFRATSSHFGIRLIANPDAGTIGMLQLGIASRGNQAVMALELRHVDLRFEIDMDGDQDHSRFYALIDTDGKYITGSIRAYTDYFGIGWRIGGLIANDAYTDFRTDTIYIFGVPLPKPSLRMNGWFLPVVGNPGSWWLNLEVKVWKWWLNVPGVVDKMVQAVL